MSDDEKKEPEETAEEGIKIKPGHLTAGSIHVAPGGLTISSAPGPSTISGTLTASTPPAPVTPPFARGGLVFPASKPVEHIPLPPKQPRRVLVAFLDGEDNPEPFWAAYLAPHSIQVNMDPRSPEEASMYLELSLVKVFEQ